MPLPFVADYAKSDRSVCKWKPCKQKINKGELRLGQKFQAFYYDGKHIDWFHSPCFFAEHKPVSEDVISGYGNLQRKDREYISNQIISNKLENRMKREALDLNDDKVVMKKAKIEMEDVDSSLMKEKIKDDQYDRYNQINNLLEQSRINFKDLEKILEVNNQGITEKKGFKRATKDLVCDILTFGALKPCSECEGQLIFQDTGYKCSGQISEWSKCVNEMKDPERFKAEIPNDLMEKYPLLKGIDPKVETRITKNIDIVALKDEASSFYDQLMPKSKIILLKNGSAVDPDSELQNEAHIYNEDGKAWSSDLIKADVQTSQNSYYKLQLIEADDNRRYWVFRSWGRIGTNNGSYMKNRYRGLKEAKQDFENMYFAKTGNLWGARRFQKHPGKYYELNIDYNDDQIKKESKTSSNLPVPTQNLVKMIFDIDSMTDFMVELNLDMDKMPLGKLSDKQIRLARGVLTDLEELIKRDASPNDLLSASNRFYHHIPHNVGEKNLPILNKMEYIEEKIATLNSLQGIKMAYGMLQVNSASSSQHLDKNYKELNTEIIVLDKTSEEFITLAKYVKNTHGPTHEFKIEIEEIFKLQKEVEPTEPFKKKQLHNKRLLWHGSHISQFAKILSQGLKIAPPGASISGCKFGSGIYFTDMISKAAEYTKSSDTGLILLCEVALGDIYEVTKGIGNVTAAPNGKHSVKGIGKYFPNPKHSIFYEGTEIPLGKVIEYDKETFLTYNEYVVYNANQVNIQYLIKVNFKLN